MEEVVLGLGSNRSFEGQKPVELLAHAVASLSSTLKNCVHSSVYKTGALYVTNQEDFYNMVVLGGFEGTPRQLLDTIHSVENRFGRDRSREIRNGPRPLDIDIELFGNRQIDEGDLVVPHVRLTERAFVLVPLVEILRNSADDSDRDIVFIRALLGKYTPFLEKVRDQKIECTLDASKFSLLLK